MNKRFIYSLFAASVLLAGCDYNEDHFPGFDDLAHPTDVRTDTLTLLEADYKTIAELDANQSLALSKDAEGKTYVAALNAVGVNGYFTDEAPAVWYLPAFIDNRYPYLDNGSKITVDHKTYGDLPAYLKDFNGITAYDLTSADYEKVWGEGSSVSFFTPSTIRQLPNVLKESIQEPADGAMRLVNYAYSETEPGGGSSTEIPVLYQQVTELDEAGGVYVMAAQGSDGNYYPFGKLDSEERPYGYIYPDPIGVTDGIISSDEGKPQAMTLAKMTTGYSLQNEWGQYLYMSGNFDNFNMTTSLPAEGGEWTITPNGDGTFAVTNVAKGKSVKLTLYNDSYSYGSYLPERFETTKYLDAPMKEDDGAFKAQDIQMGDQTYVWSYDEEYGYWKGSSYVNGSNQVSESWLVSTEIDLSNATNPVFKADMAINFLRGANRADFVNVLVSDDYAGDVTAATWKEVEVTNWSEGTSWTFVPTGEVSLEAYKGKKVHIAFKYVSNESTAVTWEVKNVVVAEKSNYWDVCLFKEVPEGEVAAQALATTRAASQANASAVYRYNATSGSWSQYSADEADIAVLQPSDYAQMGYSYIGNPEETLPTYLRLTYPYAQAGDVAAVVYYANDEGGIAATEFAYDGAAWSETTVAQDATITFQKADGEWIEARVYYESTLLDGEDGGFTAQDIELSTLTYVWTLDTRYGWKASAYSGGNIAAESWLVSPEIDLTNAVAPILRFDAAINFLNGRNVEDYITVSISTDYDGDATTATWEQLEVAGWPEGNDWDFVSITPVDLTSYTGHVIRLGFHYKSTLEAAPTVEFKNLSVQE